MRQKIFGEVVANNIPKLLKVINLQIEEVQKNPKQYTTYKTTHRTLESNGSKPKTIAANEGK